jgi:thiol:disulfide interchange protein
MVLGYVASTRLAAGRLENRVTRTVSTRGPASFFLKHTPHRDRRKGRSVAATFAAAAITSVLSVVAALVLALPARASIDLAGEFALEAERPVPTFSTRPLAAGDAAPAAGSGPAPTEISFDAFDDKQFMQARRSGSPVVLFFESDGCVPCSKMHASTFRAPAVLEAAAGIRFFRVNLSSPDSYVDLVQKSFRVTGAPTLVVFGQDGAERSRRFGFVSPEAFVEMLDEGRKPPPGNDRKHS